jgi:hypothetical protein
MSLSHAVSRPGGSELLAAFPQGVMQSKRGVEPFVHLVSMLRYGIIRSFPYIFLEKCLISEKEDFILLHKLVYRTETF